MQLTSPLNKRLSLALIVAILGLSLLAAAIPAQVATAQTNCADTHTVKEGETIYRVARRYKVTALRIARTNNLTEPYALTIGQKLCIPEQSTYTNAKFTANLTGAGIGIDGTDFRKQVVFYVRVRENDTQKYVKVGSVKSDRNGAIEDRIQLSKDWQKKNILQVCLKNAFTDDLICTRALRQ
jgi:spore germination protein YaaH